MPAHLVNKIAAGEVVERPASVVKELVENALDAGARRVTVDLRDGGAALVRVTDDGEGMTAEDLALALERHATSKLAEDADLDAIGTLGFRGEALPAICAVSRFSIATCPREQPEGTRVAGAGGEVERTMTAPGQPGTIVEISDLFFNTPARLKFLKAASTELAATLRTLTQLALAHPAVAFRVTSNGRAVLSAPAARSLRERAGAVWGWEVAERLLELAHVDHGVAVHGLAGPPDLARGSRDDVIVVVNARPVRDPALFHAVLEGYRPLLARDRFPLVVLALSVPAADVDVNVHPTKAWVRFRHPRLVHAVVVEALTGVLRRPAVVPETRVHAGDPATTPDILEAVDTAAAGQGGLFAEPRAAYTTGDFGRVLGQVQDTFVVAASETEVFFVDQHAAHERVLFEQLRESVAAGTVASQELLFPEPLALGPGPRALLERWRAPLERLGFAFEGFGGDAVLLRAVPALLKDDEPRRVIEAAVDELGGPRAGEPVIDRVLSFVACRAAIKANMPLARAEMERLVTELAGTTTPYFCPHGRPTMSRVAMNDIRRDVRRLW